MTQDSRLHAEAFRKFIEVKEELSKDERELLQVGCAYFIESLLIGGDAERALKAMETNLTSPMPELSNVTGRKTLRGMVDLVFKPYTTRQAYRTIDSVSYSIQACKLNQSTLHC